MMHVVVEREGCEDVLVDVGGGRDTAAVTAGELVAAVAAGCGIDMNMTGGGGGEMTKQAVGDVDYEVVVNGGVCLRAGVDDDVLLCDLGVDVDAAAVGRVRVDVRVTAGGGARHRLAQQGVVLNDPVDLERCFVSAVNDLDAETVEDCLLSGGISSRAVMEVVYGAVIVDHGDVVTWLAHRSHATGFPLDVETPIGNDGETCLAQAVAACECELNTLVTLVTDLGCSVHARNEKGETCLALAVSAGYADVVVYLLDAGARGDVGIADVDGRTCLMRAASTGVVALVDLLLEAGADAKVRDRRGRPALLHASSIGAWDIVRCLVAHGAGVDARDRDGRTCLMHAAHRGDVDVVRFLVAVGADVTARDRTRRSPLSIARGCGATAIVEYLEAVWDGDADV